jgi:hypothetical protein
MSVNLTKTSIIGNVAISTGLPDFRGTIYTKTGENVPNDPKLYHSAIKYTKWSVNLTKTSIIGNVAISTDFRGTIFTKMGENVPNDPKLYHSAIKYTKWSDN